MQTTINHALFGWYPYVCLIVFLLGSLLRFDREQYTWKTGSSQLLRRRQLMWGSNLFHVGILVIFVGHFVGLLTPIWVFDMMGIGHGFKQLMAIWIGGIAGIFCLIGIALLTHRRLFDARIRATSSFGDIAILLILFAQLLLGLATIPVSMGHLDGHEMDFSSQALPSEPSDPRPPRLAGVSRQAHTILVGGGRKRQVFC